MTRQVKIEKPKPETRLAPEERAARDRRAANATVANLPGTTRQPFKRRANAPTVHHHTPLQTKNS